MKLDELRAQANPAETLGVEADTPVLVGCGLLPDELPQTDGMGTLAFSAPSLADLEQLRKTEALAGRVWPLFTVRPGADTITVGRRPKNDVVIPDFPISAFHCFFQPYPGGMAIIDCGSKNGTSINGRKLVTGRPAWVSHRDMVTMGRFAFRYFPSLAAALADDNAVGSFIDLAKLAAA